MNLKIEEQPSQVILIQNESQMQQFGLLLGRCLNAGDIVGLTGDLGAGKTTLTKSIAKGMGIEEHITSPTFTIVNEYDGDEAKGLIPLYHFDVYRISDEEELYDIGYEEYFFSKAACVIEWANLIPNLMPEESLWLDLRLGMNDPEERIIHLHFEDHFATRVEAILKEMNL